VLVRVRGLVDRRGVFGGLRRRIGDRPQGVPVAACCAARRGGFGTPSAARLVTTRGARAEPCARVERRKGRFVRAPKQRARDPSGAPCLVVGSVGARAIPSRMPAATTRWQSRRTGCASRAATRRQHAKRAWCNRALGAFAPACGPQRPRVSQSRLCAKRSERRLGHPARRLKARADLDVRLSTLADTNPHASRNADQQHARHKRKTGRVAFATRPASTTCVFTAAAWSGDRIHRSVRSATACTCRAAASGKESPVRTDRACPDQPWPRPSQRRP